MNEQKNEVKNEAGIGGWLILVLIGLIITPIRIGITLFKDYVPLFDSMSLFDDYPNLQTMIYVEFIINIVFGILAIILLVMMINKDRRFPKLMVIFYISNLVFVIADAIYASQISVISQFVGDDDSIQEIARAVIGSAIWVPYMLMSTRVKRTFIK